MEKLIFIYNADSGFLNTMADISHKILSPQTYSCGLCMLTHGKFSENEQWQHFRENSSVKMEFYHKDEFESRFGKKFDYPCILSQQGSDFSIELNKDQISELSSVGELILQIENLVKNT